MVVLNCKLGNDPAFLFETTVKEKMSNVIEQVAEIYNGRLRVQRLCDALEQLAAHGIMKPPQMQGLTDDQIQELKLKDESDKYYPSGGSTCNPDPIGLRTGQAPNEKIADVIRRTVADAKAMVSKDQVKSNVFVTSETITDCIDKLRGAAMIAYPMGLPAYDSVQQILSDQEELAGTQAEKDIIPSSDMELWWAGKQLQSHKLLSDFVGKNEKTKIVCKIQRSGRGPPSREPAVDEETQKSMMAYAYKKQEEWKKLEQADDDAYLNSPWADNANLKRQLQGTHNIRWR